MVSLPIQGARGVRGAGRGATAGRLHREEGRRSVRRASRCARRVRAAPRLRPHPERRHHDRWTVEGLGSCTDRAQFGRLDPGVRAGPQPVAADCVRAQGVGTMSNASPRRGAARCDRCCAKGVVAVTCALRPVAALEAGQPREVALPMLPIAGSLGRGASDGRRCVRLWTGVCRPRGARRGA